MGEYFPVSIIRGYTKSTLPMEGRSPHRLSPTTPPTPPSLSPRSLSPPFPDPFLSSASLPSPGIPPPLSPPSVSFYSLPSSSSPPSNVLREFPNPPNFILFPDLPFPPLIPSPPSPSVPNFYPRFRFENPTLSIHVEVEPDRDFVSICFRNVQRIQNRLIHILQSFRVGMVILFLLYSSNLSVKSLF